MMRILIATLLLCSVADAQSISVSGGRKSLIISGVGSKGTPKHIVPEKQETIAVSSGGSDPVLLEKTENPNRFKFSTKSAETVKESRRYLAMFTASYCGPCQSWKRNVKPQLEAAGHHVQVIEMTDPANCSRYGRRISSLPSFIVCDWDTGEWLSDVTVGGIDLTTAKRMLGGSDRVTKTPVATTGVISSPPARYIQWPGWGTIDLETYNLNCNCSMCVSIRAKQWEYRQQMLHFQRSQTQVTPDQEGCPHDVVESMLDAMELRSDDVLGDLGCGDGRILIAAAKRGIRGIGVEIDGSRADLARRNVKEAGFDHLVTIETGDALEFDLSRVTTATAYLYPPLLEKLSEKLKQVRVAASPFHEVPGLQMAQIGDVWVTRN
jgi:hypothetical protein